MPPMRRVMPGAFGNAGRHDGGMASFWAAVGTGEPRQVGMAPQQDRKWTTFGSGHSALAVTSEPARADDAAAPLAVGTAGRTRVDA